jgi:hypothetical protein
MYYTYETILLFLFLRKLRNYEENLYLQLKREIGVPLLGIGDKFYFKPYYECLKDDIQIYRVTEIRKIRRDYVHTAFNHLWKEQYFYYKYMYVNDNEKRRRLMEPYNSIEDFFINEDYIVIKRPSVPLLTGGDYNQST